jgi:hypothetical protein
MMDNEILAALQSIQRQIDTINDWLVANGNEVLRIHKRIDTISYGTKPSPDAAPDAPVVAQS